MRSGWFLLLILILGNPVAVRCQNSSVFDVRADQNVVRPNDITRAIGEICPAKAITRTEDGKIIGCAECPPGTAFSAGEDLDWELKRATLGHFVSPNSETLLLSGSGCEPHSLNFGGTFVFALELGKPRLLDYRRGLITEDCQKLPRGDGLEFLECADRSGMQGFEASYLYSVIFDSTGKSAVQAVFTADDDVRTCGVDNEWNYLGSVHHSYIKAARFRHGDGAKPLEMSVTVAIGRRVLTKAESDACIRRPDDPRFTGPPVAVNMKDYRLHFLFDGRRFEAARSSREIQKLFPKPEYPLGISH